MYLKSTLLLAVTALGNNVAMGHQHMKGDPIPCPPVEVVGEAVSVCGDATYTIPGPICSGPSSGAPAGTGCPKLGDVATADCWTKLKSYDEYHAKCIAPEDAHCVPIHTGVWGCVFPSVQCEPPPCVTTTPEPCPTTPKPCPPRTEVSVCGDATYAIHGSVCSGPSSSDPVGTGCPKKGDVAVADCYKHLKSYDEYAWKCIAPEDAVCMPIHTGAWGCVFPSVKCEPPPCTTTTPEPCPTTTEPTPCPPVVDQQQQVPKMKKPILRA